MFSSFLSKTNPYRFSWVPSPLTSFSLPPIPLFTGEKNAFSRLLNAFHLVTVFSPDNSTSGSLSGSILSIKKVMKLRFFLTCFNIIVGNHEIRSLIPLVPGGPGGP